MKQLIVLTMILFTSGCTNTRELDTLNILVFSKTEGYRHESISSGIQMLTNQQLQQKWNVTASEDAGIFNDEYLGGIDVVVFLNPSGDGLNEQQQAAFEKFIRAGKGFVGIHSSADFEYEWPWYGQLNGAHFKVHPPSQEGTLIIEDTSHPAMKPFSGMKTFTTYDEWYTFKSNPRPNVNVLATLDETSIKVTENDDWKMGDHPIIWWHEFEGSRSFYTGFGHTHEAFKDELIIEHIVAAINWAGYRK
jgi:uncharacterized protein